MSAGGDPASATQENVAALIPAYLEEAHIAEVVAETRRHASLVMVIDDGSPDRTAVEAMRAGALVIRHERNQGKGAALKTGLRELQKHGQSHIVLLDADGQHRPSEIPRFLEEWNRSASPLLIGSRMSDTARMPLVRRLTNRLMSWLISGVAGQSIPDSQCGFRMIHRSLIPMLFCEANAYEYETEMLFVASRAGFTIGSVPISTIYGTEKSKIRPLRDALRFLRLLIRYRRGAPDR